MKFSHAFRPAVLAASSLLTALLATTAYAQAAAAPAPPAPTASGSPALSEIVVTAQKRQENLQRAPLAATAITAKQVAAANIINEDRLQTLVPGLQVTRGGSQAVVFLRGIGNTSGSPGNEPAVSTYVDGVYHPSPAASVFAFNDVAQIEVLKGPQGTLFGRNAAGGVISIVTKDPSSTPTMNASIGYGSYDTVSGSFYASGGLGDHLAADVAVVGANQGQGWGRNVYNGAPAYLTNNFDARSKVLFTPDDNTRIALSADYDASRDDEGADYVVLQGTKTNTGVSHAGGFYDIDVNYNPSNHDSQVGTSLNIQHDFDWARLTSITSWRYAQATAIQDTGGTALDTINFRYHEDEETETQEINLQSKADSQIKWIGGFYFFDDYAKYDPLIQTGVLFGSPTGGIATRSDQQTYSYAGYGQVTAPLLSDDTHITGGLRYTVDDRSASGSRVAYPSGAPVALHFAAGWPSQTSADKLTYKASLDHEFTRDIMAYFTYSTGFKSGNYNLATITQLPTQAETLTAYEAGVKSEWFDRRLRLNVAGYHYDFDNLQVQAITSAGAVQTNAAAAKFNGVDVDLAFIPIEGLQFTESASYIDATYSSFPGAPCTFPLPGGGYSASVKCNVTGKRVALVDPFSESTAVDFSRPVQYGSIDLEATVSYQSGYYWDVQNTIKQNPYALVSASATWFAPGKRWSLSLFGNNLAGVEYYSGTSVTAGVGAAYTAAPPRTVGVRAAISL